MFRSKYAVQDTLTFVEPEFACHGQVYTIRRNQQEKRLGLLRDQEQQGRELMTRVDAALAQRMAEEPQREQLREQAAALETIRPRYVQLEELRRAQALGLSEMIQRQAGGIRFDTMFVDEGFGSLDEESLRTAMDTLTSLSGADRLVGIISHVGELKERIDKQIIVSKTREGYSTARIRLE